jgi:hypothetical protein
MVVQEVFASKPPGQGYRECSSLIFEYLKTVFIKLKKQKQKINISSITQVKGWKPFKNYFSFSLLSI